MKEHKVYLKIASANGDWEHEFSTHMKIHALKVEAMAHLHMEPSQADQFELVFNGQVLDENKTLGELNIPDHATLILQKKEVIKI